MFRRLALVSCAVLCAASLGAQEITPCGATASTSDTNLPANVIDNNLATRWSGSGDGAWVQIDLCATQTVGAISVGVYQGNARHNQFELQVSTGGGVWTTVFSGQSNGTSTQEQMFDITDQPARWVRYFGHMSDVGTWNSVTEISTFAGSATTPTPTPTPSPTATPTEVLPSPTPVPTATPTVPLPDMEITPGGAGASASTNDGNTPANAVDNNLATRWSANGDGQWLQLDLGSVRTVTRVGVAAYVGNTRQNRFDLQVSNGASGPWVTLLSGALTSGTSTNETSFDVSDTNARYVRYLGHGNTSTDPAKAGWNSVTEMSVFGSDCGGCVTPTPTPAPTATPTPTPTLGPTATPTPTPGGVGNFPPRTFAPYAETWNNRSLTGFASANGGHKFYTLAFIINGGGTCNPMWNGDTALGTHYRDHINNLRAQGGDVIVSFGGASGTEIGVSCTTVSSLQAAYQKVIDAYNVRWLDLDIEGSGMGNTTAIDRRNKAITALQAANPGLRISYTLAVDRAGLPSGQINLLKNAKTNGTRVDVVNIMAMDYGPCYTDMGQAAIDAANATRSQLSSNGISAKVGVTPMTGVNDVTCENFTTANASQLVSFAQANSFVRTLGYWSLDRDGSRAYLNVFKTFH